MRIKLLAATQYCTWAAFQAFSLGTRRTRTLGLGQPPLDVCLGTVAREALRKQLEGRFQEGR